MYLIAVGGTQTVTWVATPRSSHYFVVSFFWNGSCSGPRSVNQETNSPCATQGYEAIRGLDGELQRCAWQSLYTKAYAGPPHRTQRVLETTATKDLLIDFYGSFSNEWLNFGLLAGRIGGMIHTVTRCRDAHASSPPS